MDRLWKGGWKKLGKAKYTSDNVHNINTYNVANYMWIYV